MSRDLPLRSVQAFAEAARRGSFRDAARHLGVTPSAVSHHVRALEALVGAALFTRGVRQIALTPLGRRLADGVLGALDEIDRGLAEARAVQGPPMLRVTSLPMFTSVWLLPRLARFQAGHPDVEIRIESSSRLVDLATEPFDVAIRHVDAPTPGATSHKLLDLRATPLCAPEIGARLTSVDDLLCETLIHMGSARDGWRRWLDAAGRPDLDPAKSLTVDSAPAGLDAALHGRGLVLGLAPLVWHAPQAAGLVAPFAGPTPEAGAYFIAHRTEDRGDATVRAFVAWVRREMRDAAPPT